MKKLKMHSPDITEKNITSLRKLFPSCVTESRDKSGKPKLAIDFDLLRQELSKDVVEGSQECYQLNWPGKREALLAANEPISKTLRPCSKESVNFDTTKNLFIEGDNLEALKLLQENYLGKVKMIYIDPPYNTGNDFIYKDNFAEKNEDFLKRSNQKDEKCNQLIANTESNGRFHSDWLSMIYPRLKLARNLLREDGIIFISIDDNEVHNLRKLCDEIFGCDSFISQLIWKKRTGSNDSINRASIDHDYVLVFGKNNTSTLSGVEKDFLDYENPDNDPRGPWTKGDLTCNKTASERPNLFYPIIDPKTNIKYQCNPNRVWAYEKDRMNRMINEKKIIFPDSTKGTPTYKRHLAEIKSDRKPFSSILETVLNSIATKETRELLGGQYFDYPKSVSLLTLLIQQGTTRSEDIILDFFAGSSTTAHAVMQLNAKDGGNRKFIMVQLPENCDKASEAYKAGFKTIAEISKERIRRAGKKILKEDCHEDWHQDIGFRVLKIDSSNMSDIYYTPDAIDQLKLNRITNNVKSDRSPDDLLFQVLVDWGVDLSLPITKKVIKGKTVFFVDENALLACFDAGINEAFVKELTTFEPLRIVFRDNGFTSDSVKINVEQIFKQLSPHTEVKSI